MKNKWIKISERLPPMEERVLMCIKEPNFARSTITIGKRIPHDRTDPNNPRWHWSKVMRDSDVTHWQPLPQLPNDNE